MFQNFTCPFAFFFVSFLLDEFGIIVTRVEIIRPKNCEADGDEARIGIPSFCDGKTVEPSN